MLYSIIPPALVVLSLVGIIIILVKKAPQVAGLEDGRNAQETQDVENVGNRRSIWKRIGGMSASLIGKTKMVWTLIQKIGGIPKNILVKLKDRRQKRIGKDLSEIENEIKEGGVQTEEEKYDSLFARRKRGRENRKIEIQDEEIYLEEETEKETAAEEASAKKEILPGSSKKDLFEKILIDRIATNPKDIEAYERLGEYYMETENWEYAKECFKQVLKLNPRNIGARSRMRKLERILGK